MIGHQRFEKKLLDYLEGELSLRDREKVQDHLNECPICRGDIEKLKGVREQLMNQSVPMPGPDLWAAFPARIRSAVAREKSKLKKRKAGERSHFWFPFGWAPSGAFALVIVGVLGFLLMRGGDHETWGPELILMDPEELMAELADMDPTLLEAAIPDRPPIDENWMVMLSEVGNEEIEVIFTAWELSGDALWPKAELLNEIYGEGKT